MRGNPGQEGQSKRGRGRRILLRLLAVLVLLYISFGAFIWWAMHRPPEDFGRVMTRVPQAAVFGLFPFEALWIRARAGNLKIGDPAPDFSLLKVDKSGSIRLSELNKQRPVVLVFGSYT